MEPIQFYSLILPLAIIVLILTILVVYYARKGDKMRITEIQVLNQLMHNESLNKVNFSTILQELVEEKIINKESFTRMGQLLEEHFNEPENEQKKDVITKPAYKKKI
jgi:hypothetical protein